MRVLAVVSDLHVDTARRAFDAGLEGDFEPVRRALELLGSERSDVAAAWATALRALWWLADPARGRLPVAEAAMGWHAASAGAREAYGLACAQAERAALLSGDLPGLETWLEVHQRVAAGADGPGAIWLGVGRWFAWILRGELDDYDKLGALESRALAHGIAPLVVEAAALRGLAALLCGDIGAATAIARRAARMARTQGLPQQEYLANLVLARVHRRTDRAHLALRIVTALERVVPTVWYPWLAWERMMSGGGLSAGQVNLTTSAGKAARALAAFIDACRRGDAEGLVRSREIAHHAFGDVALWRRDLDLLDSAIDPTVHSVAVGGQVGEWCRGAGGAPPEGLLGVARDPHDDVNVAYVIAAPDAFPRRVLGLAGALVGPILQSSRPARVETAIAVLALAGTEGLDKNAYFRRVYGGQLAGPDHHGSWDVLLRRVGQLLGDRAEVLREGEHFELRVHAPFAVPDPRCSESLEDTLLRTLSDGRATVSSLADRVGVPENTLRGVLDRLVEDDACVAEKSGARVEYRVEDVSFPAPMRTS